MLINTNGLAIFGPGSEWFWSMAQFVVVVVTLVGIYRQLRAQGAANALHRMEALQGLYQSDRMEYTKLALALDLKYEPISDHTFAMARALLNFFVDLDNLYDEGYITLKEIAEEWGRPLQVWSALLAPVVERQREIEGLPVYDMHELVDEQPGEQGGQQAQLQRGHEQARRDHPGGDRVAQLRVLRNGRHGLLR